MKVRVMRCRICSEMLKGRGKVCEDCMLEIDRGRMVARAMVADDAAASALAPSLPLADTRSNASAPAHRLWGTTRQSRAIAFAVACSVALASAAAAYFEWRALVPGAAPLAVAHVPRTIDPAPGEFAAAGAAALSSPRAEVPKSWHKSAVPPHRAAASGRSAVREPAAKEPKSTAMPATSPATLAAALAPCRSEFLLARFACEQRARAKYCEHRTGQVPECPQTPIFTDRG